MGSYRTYSISGKTAALLPEFAVEDLPSAELEPRFLHLQRRTCPWAEPSNDDDNKQLLRESALHKHYFNIGEIGLCRFSLIKHQLQIPKCYVYVRTSILIRFNSEQKALVCTFTIFMVGLYIVGKLFLNLKSS